ncbi:pleckstrin homology domain-containing family S member 1-like [Brienomyrus brachyistius]|uniref:pleckstrin homology domain-containing family S member 1-like n=1 Tax=Brienomyrus brachyistius TaxID=42636 RepID=UPI0020B398B2|nr:pleckstrin homology domain-containing family S member 1-like [Brienomyrus brachyistius]
MLGKNAQRISSSKSVFYAPAADVEEVRTGHLIKSPPAGRFKSQKSWKRRFFVLFKTSWGTHLLKYYRSEDERDKAQGVIDLSKISTIYPAPENQNRWEWIHKTFKCLPDCVLYIHANDRDYYLISERKFEVDGWFSDIHKALRNLYSKEDLRNRSASAPSNSISLAEHQASNKTGNMRPASCQEIKAQEDDRQSHYDTPKSVLDIMSQGNEEDNDDDDDDDNDDDDDDEAEEEESFYIKMDRVYEMLEGEEQLYENYPMKQESQSLSSVTEETKRMKIVDPQVNNGGWSDSWTEENITEDIADPLSLSKTDIKQRDRPLSQEACEKWQEELDGNKIPMQKDISVDLSDLKHHLKLEDADGTPCVSEWSPHFGSTCLFHKGDQILAVNDMKTDCAADLQMFLGKLLKQKVTVTLLRFPGSSGFQPGSCSCK